MLTSVPGDPLAQPGNILPGAADFELEQAVLFAGSVQPLTSWRSFAFYIGTFQWVSNAIFKAPARAFTYTTKLLS